MSLGDDLGGMSNEGEDTRSQLGLSGGEPDTILEIGKNSKLLIRGSTRQKTYTIGIGSAFILGNTTNGVLGSPQLGASGTQLVLGDGRETAVLIAVQNQDDIFYEDFTNTRFEGTGSGVWGSGELVF